MRRLRLCLNWIILLAPLIFLGVGAVRLVRGVFNFLNSNRRLAGTMSAEATRALGRTVRINDVRITGNLWSLDAPNRIDLYDVYVANGATPAAGALARARRIAIWYNLRQAVAPVRALSPIVDEVHADSPEVLLERNASGRWNYQDLLRPRAPTARSLTDKVSFTSATLLYTDQAFPHPPGVPERPLNTRLAGLHGVVLIRHDKSVAFDVAGLAEPKYLHDFHAVGTVVPSPLSVQSRLVASRVALPELADRLTPPPQLRVSAGHADVDIGFLYVPPVGTPPWTLDTRALIAHGTVSIQDASAAGKLVYAPVEHLSGHGTFTTDSILGSATGIYDGMPMRVDGAVLGLTLPPLGGGQHTVRPAAPPTLSLRGTVAGADWARISRLAFVPAVVERLPQVVRRDLRRFVLSGDLNYQVAGPADNPDATVSGRVARAEYGGYRGDNLDVTAAYVGHTLRASVKGTYAGGPAVVRGAVSFDETGAFEAQAQGRDLDLSRVAGPRDLKLTGRGQLDFAIRGRRGITPSITAQAEVDNAAVNGQSIRHAFAKADTVGPQLVLRSLTADDPKGFVVASGTIGLKSRQLNLIVDADELNFGSIAKAAAPHGSGAGAKRIAANSAANSIIGRLSDVQGYGYARTRLTGTVDRPSLEGQIYAYGVQLGAVELDKVTLSDLVVSRDEVRLSGVASRYPGQLHVAGNVLRPFSSSPELQLDARVDHVDLETMRQLAGVERKDLVLTGTVSTDNIQIRGTLSSPQTPDFFTANFRDATVNGIPVQNAALTMRYQVEGLYVKSASATVAEGLVVGSGWLPFEGPLNFTIHGGGLALQPLEEAAYFSAKPDQNPIVLRGSANFDASITGTLKQPIVTARSITTDSLFYNGFEIGSVRARGSYADRRVRLDSLVVDAPGPAAASGAQTAGGSIAVNGLTFDQDTGQIRTDPGHPIRFDAIPLERVHALAYASVDVANGDLRKALEDLRDVSGPISATVALQGTLDNPRADVTWNGMRLKIHNYDITSITGSASIDKDRLIFPSPATPNQRFRIESPYVDVQSPSDPRTSNIVIGFDHDGKHGQITTILRADAGAREAVPADISISNINLEFLQQVLGKSVTSRIEGAGDIGITAQGRTLSPDLDFTANLRNVAVYSAVDPKAPPITLDRVELLEGSVREGVAKIGSLRAIKNDPVTRAPYETSVSAVLTGFTYEPPFLPDKARLSVQGELPVTFISLAVPGILRDTSRGTISAHVDISSIRKNPIVSGEVGLNVPRLEFGSLSTGIQDLIATLRLDNDRLTVASFSAHTYIYGSPRAKEANASDAIVAAAAATPAQVATPSKAAPRLSSPTKSRAVAVSESDPKRRGSEIRLTGSLPLGFADDRTTGRTEGIFIRIFDPAAPEAGQPAPTGKTVGKSTVRQAALTFDEDPIPNSRTGVLKGSLSTDPNRPLQIRGSLKEPILTGRITLYNALVTPPAEQKPGTFVLPILPTFDLALQLGSNVRIHTPQLDARLSTDRDIVARGRLVQNAGDVSVDGTVQISDGKLKLPTASFTILPGASLHVNYPTYDAGEKVLGLNIDLMARGFIYATSQAGVRKRYEVTVTARGPLTGESVDPITGRPALALSFETNPNDLASSQAVLQERLAGAIIGVDLFDQVGRNPGQAFTSVLTGVFTGTVLPGIFDRTAENLGFEELSLGYDPVDRLTLNISRHLFGPLYVSYYRTLNAVYERYDLKLSLRFKNNYQLSYDLDEQHTQKFLLEGVWKF